jgi:hypothetical protein
MDDPSVLYLYLALCCIVIFCAVLGIAILVGRRREKTDRLSGGVPGRRIDAP